MKVLEGEGPSPKIQLDLKDKKLLFLLSLNARLPLSKCAKSLNLSRDAVKYRLNRLEENKVIQGYKTVINANKLGYFSYHLFLELHHTRENEAKLTKFFIANENVNALLKYSGKWDFEIAFLAENPFAFEKFLSQTIEKAGTIQDYEILILLETIKSSVLPGKFVEKCSFEFDYGRSDTSFSKQFEANSKEEYKLDEKDLKILRILSEDARAQVIGIGKKVGLSNDAVSYRIKKMIESKIISSFRPVVNFAPLGISIYAVLLKLQNISEEREEKFKNFLKSNKNILWAVKTIGRVNILAYVAAESQSDFHETMAEMKSKFGEIVKNYESLFAYQELKYTYLPEGIKLQK